VLRERPVTRASSRMLVPCFLRIANSICSSAFSIGPSVMEGPPTTVGQTHAAELGQFRIAGDIGARLRVPDSPLIPPLPDLIRARVTR
jgi:hypothetical protein